MKVAGFCTGHDCSYAILENGIPIIHNELERFIRAKEPTDDAIKFMCDTEKDVSDISYFTHCIHPWGDQSKRYPESHKKLLGKYPYIQEGDKIKFLHMKTPNTYQSTSISFMTKLPKELKLHDFIDYEMQFEKSFIEPLKFITDIIQWQIDGSYGTQSTLEDFF